MRAAYALRETHPVSPKHVTRDKKTIILIGFENFACLLHVIDLLVGIGLYELKKGL
jgi:hypothetical protein